MRTANSTIEWLRERTEHLDIFQAVATEPSRRFCYFGIAEPSIVLTVPQFQNSETVKTVPLFCGDGTVNMYTSRLLLMVPPVAGSEDEP